MYGDSASIAIERCLFTNNVTPFDGVIDFADGSLIMRDSLVAENQCAGGRGTFVLQSSTATLLNDTVADNGGGGLVANNDALTVRNCIFWGNADYAPELTVEQQQAQMSGGTHSISYSIIQGLNQWQDPAKNNSPYDPLFVDEGAGNYQLTYISPALGAGSSLGLATSDTDLLGNPLQSGYGVDIGAYAFTTPPGVAADLNWNFSSRFVCLGGVTTFSVSNANPSASMVVYWMVNTGAGFVPISDDSHYSITALTNNEVGSTLTISSADSTLNGASYQFYLGGDVNYLSQPVTLTVGPSAVVYVDAAATGAQDGSSWADAYTNLAPALQGVGGCAAIWVAGGVYPQLQTIVVPPSVEIDGGFPSGGTLDERDPAAYPTIIQGSGNVQSILDLETAEPQGQHTTFDGLAFNGGEFAINCFAGSPVVRNCLFENFTEIAFPSQGGTPYFTNCVFSNNALGVLSDTLQLSHCVFGNNAEAIESIYGSLTAADCQFLGNSNENEGGAVNLIASGGDVERCVFSSNSASVGGAIVLDEQSTLTMSDSLLSANTSEFEGGAVAGGSVTAVNCTIAGNSSALYGGAFSLYGGTWALKNCIVWNNNSSYPRYAGTAKGEIYLQGGSISATNAIIQYTTNIPGQYIVIADPLFSNAVAGNFTLSSRSPAVNAGQNAYVPGGDTEFSGVDLAGNPRIQYGVVDLGAYESSLAPNAVYLAAQPEPAVVCIGQTAVFQVAGAEGSYQWQYSLGGGWTGLADGDSIQGSPVSINLSSAGNLNTSTLSISDVGTNLNGLLVSASLVGLSYTTTVAAVTVPTNNVIFVDAAAAAGGDGTSWATAYTSLLDAISAFSPCRSQIWVAQGVYAPVATHQGVYSGFNYFFIPGGAVIYGGFPTGGGNMGSRNWQQFPTILETPHNTNGAVVEINGQYLSASNGTVLDGLTIQGGPGLTGLEVASANPTLGNLTIVGCGNGGMNDGDSGGTVENCRFLNNSAAYGGGANVSGSSTMFSNCFFLGNTALDSGGGVEIAGSTNVFINCAFQGNTALQTGGGIDIEESSPQLLDVLVTGNRAPYGGGIYSLVGQPTMVNGTVAGNYATIAGAGLAQLDRTNKIYNSILWGNRCDASPLQTLESQQAFAETGGSFDLHNTTVYGLTTLSGPSVVGWDPVFVSALDAGEAPSTNGNFDLAACSPAINFGNAGFDGSISVDLNGQPRVTAGQVDLGAYQSTPASATPLLITQQPHGFTFESALTNNIFTVSGTGDGLSYQWEVASPGGAFAPLQASAAYGGINAASLTVNQATPAISGSLFRCEVTSSEGCVAVSGEAQLTVLPDHYFVNAARPDDSGDGYTWATAFKTLAHALASPGDPSGTQIWLAAGVYKGTDPQWVPVVVGDFAGESEVGILQTGDLVYGGFNGTETNLNQRNWLTNITIVEPAATNAYIPGNGNGLEIFNLDETYVLQPDGSANAVTITLGRIDGCQLRNANTAVLSYGGSGLTIANCTFTNCDTAILQFPAEADQPAISQMDVSNCVFENVSTGAEFVAPGYNPNLHFSSVQTIENSLFIGCGDGVYVNNGGTVTIAGCTFTGGGGGIYTAADPGISGNQEIPTLTVTDDQFIGNYQGMLLGSGYLTLQRSSFRGNGNTQFLGSNTNALAASLSEGIWGGALNLYGESSYTTAEVEDCLFSGNASRVGGSAVVDFQVYEQVFRNCTFSGNGGTAIYSLKPFNTINLDNCIVWGDTDSGTNGVNPEFVSAIDSATAPNTNGNFHLAPCSLLIGTGATNQTGASLTDLDGQPRLFNGTVTPGAYEPASAPLVFSSQPTNVLSIQNQPVQFNAAVANTGGVTYNWQVSNGGGAFSNLANNGPYSGAFTPQLQFSASTAENGNLYRLRASYPSACSIYSQAASFSLYLNAVAAAGVSANGILDLPATNFGFSMNNGVNPASVNDQSVAVYAMESGRLTFSNGMLLPFTGNNGLLDPAHAVHPGEQVFVSVNASLQAANGIAATPSIFEFVNDVTSWDGAFNAPQTVVLPGNPTAKLIEAGDLNGDGSIDLFVSTSAGCRILTNNGAGQFSDSTQNLGSDAATKIILGNVRGHGLLDAVLLRDGQIEVWTNSDAGVFALAGSYSTAAPLTDMAMGLLNNDGLMDLFILTTNDNEIWWNQGAGNFADSGIHLAATNSIAVALGDFNEDGTIDAYVAHSDATPGQLWLNEGGTFVAGAGAGLPSVSSGYQRLIAAEVVGDGHLDLVAVANGQAQVWQGHGNGSFSSYASIADAYPQALSTGDINGDRIGDLIVAGVGGALTPFVGAGSGFRTLAHQSAFASASATTLADLNGDGALDLALISPTGQVEVAFYQPVELYGNENTSAPGSTDDAQLIPWQDFYDQFKTRLPSYYTGLSYIKIDTEPTNGVLFTGSYFVGPGQIVPVAPLSDLFGLYYVGNSGGYGPDSFTWEGYLQGETAPPVKHVFTFNLSIAQVVEVNAQNDYATVNQGQSVSVLTGGANSLLANDSDSGGGTLVASLKIAPAHGSVQVNADGSFTYTQDGSETHSDSFVYTATDPSSGHSASGTVFITIANVNHTPNSISFAQTAIYEGQPAGLVVGQLSATDPDPSVTGFTFNLVSGAGDTDNASFSISGNSIVTAAPLSYAAGATRSILVQATDVANAYDSGGATYQQAFTVNVLPLPVADAQSAQTPENGPATNIVLTASGVAPLKYVIVASPTNGILTGRPPNVFYQPNANFFGSDSFSFLATDGAMTSAVETVSITVNFVDQPPVVSNLSFTTPSNGPLSITLTATPFLAGETLSYQINTNGYLGGTLTGVPPNLTYTPSPYDWGTVSFSFTASEGGLTSAVAFVFINNQNQPPLAAARTNQVQENSTGSIMLFGNANNNNPLSFRIVMPPQHGAISGVTPGVFQKTDQMVATYKPNLSFVGLDSFTYVVNDGQHDSAPATMTVNVTGVPVPMAISQTVVTSQGQPVNIALSGTNQTAGFTNAPMLFEVITQPSNGYVATTNYYGSNVLYTPGNSFNGTDSFTFVVYIEDTNNFNELYESAAGTVQVVVTPPMPLASSAFYTNYGNTAEIQLAGSDPDGLTVSYQIVSLPTNGTLTWISLPEFTYTPNPGFYGLDSFTFDTYDVHGTSAVATVTFDVIEPPHPPTALSIETNAFLEIPLTIPLSAIASDILNDPLALVALPEVDNGTATFTSNEVIFTATAPNLGYGGFYFVVSNNFETSTNYLSVDVLNRYLAVGSPNLEVVFGNVSLSYMDGQFVTPIDTLPDAVSFANAYGPALPWVIIMPTEYPDPVTPVLLTEAQGSTANGDLSALDITGNIQILPMDVSGGPVTQSVPLVAASQLYSMRLFQVEKGASLSLQSCNLSGGVATEGGAILNEGQLELSNVICTANEALGDGTNPGLGGAIFSENGSIAMTNSILTNNIADLGGELYQIGDGGAAMTTVSNCIMAGSGSAMDFVSTNSHGGSSSITATRLSVEHPTVPWLGTLAASYTIESNLSVDFPVAFDPAQYQLAVSPSAPWNDGSTLQITGYGSQRKLSLSQPETSDQPPMNILVSVSNGQLTYAENFSVAVDASYHNAPIVSNLTVDVVASSYGYTGSASIPVLTNDLNPDGAQSQLTLVSVSRLQNNTGTLAIRGNNVEYTNKVFASSDSFTYVVSDGYLRSTGTVFINLIYPFSAVYDSGDSGYSTLRADLEEAEGAYFQGGWVIPLSPSISSPVIDVYSADDTTEGPSAFVITGNVVIDGSAVPGATIELPANASPMRFFHVLPGASLTLSNLTLSGGIAGQSDYGAGCGGAIYNEGALDLEGVTITGCQAIGSPSGLGGAVFNLGSVVLNGTQLTNNTSGNGGGIYQLANGSATSICMTNSGVINPQSAYDIASVVTNNGTASVVAVSSVIRNPGAPWVGELDNINVNGNQSIPFYVGPSTNTLQLTATSDNGNVVSAGNLALSGSGGLRYLTLNAVSNGVVDVLVQAALGNISFGRGFTVSVFGNSNSIPVAPDYFATIFAGETSTLPVLTNDYDLGNSPLEVVSVSCPSAGSATLTNGQVIYSNYGGTNASDSFTYVVTNTFGGSTTGQVFLTIVPAVQTVTNANEYGPGSIRAAFETIGSVQDNLTWIIAPAPSLAGTTISLTGYYPGSNDYFAFFVTKHILIDGGAAPGFTIALSQNRYIAPPMRAFKVASGALLELQNLTLTGGNSENNGSGASGFGGSIYSQGIINVSNVTFANNSVNGLGNASGGGAICNDGGTAQFFNCTFSNNSAIGTSPGAGGAILNRDGILLLVSNRFVDNSANIAANIYNLGDSDGSSTNLTSSGSDTNLLGESGMARSTLRNNYMTNSVGILDLVGATTNAGSSAIISYQTNVMTRNNPSVNAIADQSVLAAIDVPVSFAYSSAHPTLTATSSNPNVTPNANLKLDTNGNSGVLTITPGGQSGLSSISLQLTEGSLSYAQVFQVISTGSPFVTIQASGSNAVLQFYGSPGTNYYIQEATPSPLGPWQDLPGSPLSVGILGPINYTVTNPPMTSFYRTSTVP